MTTSTRTEIPFALLTEGDYHASLSRTQGRAVVLFTNAQCGACRLWKRLLPPALTGYVTHFFEVDVARDTGVARYFNIFHLPTIYLYRDGYFHAELQCEARMDAIRQAAITLFDQAPHEEP